VHARSATVHKRCVCCVTEARHSLYRGRLLGDSAGRRPRCMRALQGPPYPHLIQVLGHLAPPLLLWQPDPLPTTRTHERTCASAAPAHAQVTDLGSARYPQYRVWRTRPVWRTRAALLAYEAALAHASALDAALEACRPRRTLRDLV
jgi:hypothetical protein